jgi:hypothetical protein
MRLRRVLPAVVGMASLLITATPTSASGGGSCGGTTAPPTLPAVQLAPDTATLASGASEFVQVVLSGAAASASSLSISASNTRFAVPAPIAVDPTFGTPV